MPASDKSYPYHEYFCLCVCAGVDRRIQEDAWAKLLLVERSLLLDSLKIGKSYHDYISEHHLDNFSKKSLRGHKHANDVVTIKLLEEHLRVGTPLLKYTSVAMLADLSERENLRKKIALTIPSLMILLRPDTSLACVEPVLRVLTNLAHTKKLRRHIIAAGALPLIAGMLSSQGGHKKVSAQASKALYVLSVTTEARLLFQQTRATTELFDQFVASSLGMSTGPRTPEGKRRSAHNGNRPKRVFLHHGEANPMKG